MRFLFSLTIFFLFDLFVFQAFTLVGSTWEQPWQSLLYTFYWSIPVLGLLVLLVRLGQMIRIDRKLYTILRAVVFIAYFSKFLMALVLVIDDLRRLVLALYQSVAGDQGFDLLRPLLNAQVAMAVGSIPFFLLVYGALRNPYRYKVFREKVGIKNLPEALAGLRIVQISDIHSGSFTQKEPVKKAIQMINELQADLVFFTGDLVNSLAEEMTPFMDVFDKIEARIGVFSILGNHDYGDYYHWESIEAKRDNFRQLLDTHKQLGWDLMLNENRILQINGEKIAIIGVENYSANARFHKYGDLAKAYEGVEGTSLKLLLSHDPSHWEHEVVKRFQDIDITFSGHTHGMQFGIEIPGWLRWSPIKYIYQQWAGLYQIGEQFLYVNRGLGFLGYPGRVGILPEITVLELEKAS